MTKVKIVTDSGCNLEPGIAEKLNIEVVSLSVMIDDVIYKDTDLAPQDFMRMMADARALPKTSQPPIGEFVEIYDRLGEDGSDVISIHLTGLLSGTVSAAHQAGQISKTDVTVLDSTFADQGIAFQVVAAAEAAQAGKNKEEILEIIETVKKNTTLHIGVASLDNLVKGGRISRATGVISSLFNIRVVMELFESELAVVAKGRGVKAFNRWFEEFKNGLPQNVKQIAITHAGDLALAESFKAALKEKFPQVHMPILEASSIIATHTGAGAFAVIYYTE